MTLINNLIKIPSKWIHEKYAIPMPEGDEETAGQPTTDSAPVETPSLASQTEPEPEPEPVETSPAASKTDAPSKKTDKKTDVKLSDTQPSGFWEGFFNFFAHARTMGSRAMNLADKSTSYTAGINIDKLFEQALKDIYAEYGINPVETPRMASVQKPLFDITNNSLQSGITTAFTTEFGKIDPDFVNQFRTNTAVFSAFKAHAQQKEIVAQLLDDKGDLKSFHNFKKSVLGTSINANYNKNWLKTEYNMAVRSARMAEKWKGFEKVKHLYPNIEYIESTAATKREEHLNWVGTILPIEHPWWNTHTPPVGWGCECSIRNTDAPIKLPPGYEEPVAPVFANNPGVTAEFINLKEYPMIKAVDEVKYRILLKDAKQYAEYSPIIIKDYDNGGKVRVSNLVDIKGSDYERVLKCVEFFAKSGADTEILPKPYSESLLHKELFKKNIGTKYEKKCPDFRVDGNFYEHEGFETAAAKSAALNMLSRGLKQARRIVIDDCSIPDRYLLKQILLRAKKENDVDEVWILEKSGDLKLLFKKTEAQ